MDLKFKDNSKLGIAAAFTQLKYIESTGTQYIDTGIIPDTDIEVNMVVQLKSNTISNFFGSRNQSTCSDGSWNLFDNVDSDNKIRLDWIGYVAYSSSSIQRYADTTIKLYSDSNNRGITIVNGTTYTGINKIRGNYTLKLFGCDNAGSVVTSSIIIKEFTVKRNGVLIQNLVPSKDSRDVVCLYDTVSETFFYNQGTGNFIAGPVVPSTIIVLPDNTLLKTTTLYHKNTPNVDGIQLLNGILKYQKTHQDEIKEYYYPTTQLWQDIITEYPDIVQYYNMNHKLCVVICEADDPEQCAEDFLQAIEDYPDIADVIVAYPTVAPIILDNPSLIPIVEENPEVVHSLVDTGYETSIKGNGAQYLDTGLTGSSTMEIQLRLKYGDDNRNDLILGNDWNAGAYLLHRYKPSNYLIRAYWGGYVDCTISNVIKFVNVIYKANFISVDNTGQSITGTPSKTSGNIMLLGLPNQSYFNQVSQIGYYKRYDGNNLIQWLVPIQNNGNPCMIDLLTGTKYLNQGTGSFTYSLEPKNA